jgi:uncharacterized protein YbaR (Trm112 family)
LGERRRLQVTAPCETRAYKIIDDLPKLLS